MKDYSELVKALRCNGECHEGCAYRSEEGWCDAESKMDADAADAIEELQTKLGEQIELQTKEQGVLLDRIAELEQQLPKHGEWVDYVNSHCECSVCHAEFNYFDNCTECFNYCPNCGAKMGVQDGKQKITG